MKVEESIQKFKDSGMLWFSNMILHTFGWALVVEYEDKKPIRMYPRRVYFRGFSEEANTDGYIKVSKYMIENANELYKEANE